MADMKRKIENTLLKWKNNDNALPLMLVGARQTGKTYIVEKFCKENFENMVQLNFLKEEGFKSFFENSLNPKNIISKIEMYFDTKIDATNTVFFFDEIQVCERAIASLKFFAESKNKYRVIVAGSLLGVKINRFRSSFPVGKVQIEKLFPLDFEEFLWANGSEIGANAIRSAFEKNEPFDLANHNKLLQLYKTCLYLGGMPAVLNVFFDNGKNLLSPAINKAKQDIITGYMADMAKYSGNINSSKIIKVFGSVHLQLAQKQTKFRYKLVEEKGNKEKFETAIEWLLQAGILHICNRIEKPEKPLKSNENEKMFKLYMGDTGLLIYQGGAKVYDVFENPKFDFIGGITENYVAQQLTALQKKLYYWTSGNDAEVDFILNEESGITPCEVKADTNVTSRSLSEYVKKYSPDCSIRLSAKNFGFVNGIKSVPLYATFCI
jgi:predicted AAA+ superfamily ATPase